MTVIEKWKELNAFQAKYPAIASAIWLAIIAFASFCFLPNHIAEVPMFIAALLFFGYATVAQLAKYELALDQRIRAGELSQTWHIRLNGIDIGTMLDSAYASRRKEVYFDVRTYVRQLLNIGNVALRVFVLLFTLLPAVAFWVGVGFFILAPDSFAANLDALHQLKPANLGWFAVSFFSLYLVLFGAAMTLVPAMRRAAGFTNCFEVAVNEKIRLHVGSAADGCLSVYRLDNGDSIQPNELQYIRTGRLY